MATHVVLKQDLQRELNLARLAERRRDLACRGQIECPAWNAQVRMVQQVENFGAELYGPHLAEPAQRRVFDQREIHGAVVRTIHDAAAGIAVEPEFRQRQRARVIKQLGRTQRRTGSDDAGGRPCTYRAADGTAASQLLMLDSGNEIRAALSSVGPACQRT